MSQFLQWRMAANKRLCYLHGYIQASRTNAWLLCVCFPHCTVVHNFAILVIQAARWRLGSAWRSCSANRAHGFANTWWAARAEYFAWKAWWGCGRNNHQASCSSEENQHCAPKSWLARSTNDYRHPDPPLSCFDHDSVQLMLVSQWPYIVSACHILARFLKHRIHPWWLK